MKKIITTSIFALLLVTATNAQNWGKKKIKGNGSVTTETRTTGDYDGIKCAGSMDFILVSGKEGQIKIEGESNLLEYIVTEVKDKNLIVKVKKGVNINSSKNKGIKITIPFEDISNVSLAGSGDLISKDQIVTDNLKISLAGAGDVNLNIKTQSVKGAVAGSGDISLKGSTNKLVAKVAGSGDFNSYGLNSNDAEVSVAGSGDVKVSASNNLKARVAGSGDVTYRGNPKVDKKVAGSGDISKD
ncbi:head GIN domain-containing protein [uncultured Wocania sp.]|uniref:head GIN domain-containing protein n=1 Tax=uncultured Wocania sp. TaxID=2834404 RepID=UPI0030F52E97